MVYEKIICPYCKSDNVVKNGRNSTGRQRIRFRNKKYRTCIKNFSQYCNSSFKKTKKIAKAVNEEYLKQCDSNNNIDIVM